MVQNNTPFLKLIYNSYSQGKSASYNLHHSHRQAVTMLEKLSSEKISPCLSLYVIVFPCQN